MSLLPSILMADDDPDDRLLLEEAMEEADVHANVTFVEDGQELMDYLMTTALAGGSIEAPGLILLDLNMPRMDGREALREIKKHPSLCRIPVVILTTSRSEEDVARAYASGANSYITKPVSFDELVDVVRQIGHYWLKTVSLPQLI